MTISSSVHKINCRYCLKEIDNNFLSNPHFESYFTLDEGNEYSHTSCYEAVKHYNFSRYNGVILPFEEIDFLKKLETLLQNPIPYLKKFNKRIFCFTTSDNHIETINLYNVNLP